jgi:hypothetical protein
MAPESSSHLPPDGPAPQVPSGGRELPQHDSDYDGAWKEALRLHLPEFIEKYFPAEHAAIDWRHEPEWFDKELSVVLAQAGERNRQVDVVARVRLKNGQPQWILLHIEVQSSFESNFAARIAYYNAGLTWSFRERVLTLVVLADLRRNWRPDEDVFRVGTFETRIKFPVCKLLDRLETNWRDDLSMPVLLARAQIEALRTAGDPEARYRAKWQLVRGLYDLGYNVEQVRQIFGLIDWMMHLRKDLEERFRVELSVLEDERNMPYVTSIERLAEARGEARGRASVVLALLAEVCGPLAEQIEVRVRSLSAEQLEELAKSLLHFQSLADLEKWLDTHAAPSE